ncbi:MAG TPA: nucleoside kinase [Syntrophomonadaceae bacterium]|nr:nucleoside kinase [Syntrophomonadaceae bacterium]
MTTNKLIKVKIYNFGEYEVFSGTTVIDLLESLQLDLKYTVVAVSIDNNITHLNTVMDKDMEIKLIDTSSAAGFRNYGRSATFILMKATRDLFPNRQVIVKHSLSNGLYCEFYDVDTNAEEVGQLEKKMHEIVSMDIPIKKLIMPKEEAVNIFKRQKEYDKVDLLAHIDKKEIHVYELDGFYEYFHGNMVPKTSMVKKFRLISYSHGLILQIPQIEDPSILKPYIEQKKLAGIFREAKEWADMLETPHVAALNGMIEQEKINEIIQVNEALHEKKIALIADEICHDSNKRIILISGPSSSGKTTFAQRLLIQLRVNGRRPVSISLDNYFVDRPLTPKDEDGNLDFEALEAIKLDLFNDHLTKLLKGEEVEVPVFNFIEGRAEPNGALIKVPVGEPIILEGIHALNDKLTYRIPTINKYNIYVSALTQLNIDYTNRIPTTDCRLLRRMVRDNRTRGIDAISTINRWASVRRGEEKNIFPFQENADVMFNTSLVYELAIIKPLAEQLLRAIGPGSEEYAEARRLLKFLSYFKPIEADGIPPNSILREFIGGSCFKH